MYRCSRLHQQRDIGREHRIRNRDGGFAVDSRNDGCHITRNAECLADAGFCDELVRAQGRGHVIRAHAIRELYQGCIGNSVR